MSAPAASLRSSRGIARCAAALCALAVIAAVVSYVNGSWIVGTVWVLLAGLSSNMAWYYGRRARRASATGPSDGPAGSASRGATAAE